MLALHSLSLYNIVIVACPRCSNLFLLSMQMNPSGKVQLSLQMFQQTSLFFLYPRNQMIFMWNSFVDEYIGGVFYFAHIFLASHGVVLLFHPNDFKVLKEVKSYLESYGL